MSEEKDTGWIYKEIVVYGILGIFSVAFIIAGHYFEALYPLVSHLFNELGIAGVIACIFAISIERSSRERFTKLAEKERDEIKHDVFQYVYGYKIPSEITNEIDVQILRSYFIRRNCMVSYTLEPITNNSYQRKYLRIKAAVSFELHNLTPEPKPFIFNPMIAKAPIPLLEMDVKFLSLSLEGCENPLELNEDDIRDILLPDMVQGHLTFEREIKVLPNQHTIVTTAFQMIKPIEDGADYFLSAIQTSGFDLKVFVPTDELQVFAYAYGPEEFRKGVEHQPNFNRYHWTLRRPLLPYQGVYLTWRPKAIAISSTSLNTDARP